MGTPIHGAGAVIYLSADSGSAAIPLAEQVNYSIELDADIQDASALGSVWGSSVKGMNKWSGSCDGNFDTGSKTLWTAGTSATAVKMYLYPLATSPTLYYYGSCFVKLGKVISGGVAAKSTSGFSFTGQGELAVKP
jgi:hypothetical protein